jgi:hypothetical protein
MFSDFLMTFYLDVNVPTKSNKQSWKSLMKKKDPYKNVTDPEQCLG